MVIATCCQRALGNSHRSTILAHSPLRLLPPPPMKHGWTDLILVLRDPVLNNEVTGIRLLLRSTRSFLQAPSLLRCIHCELTRHGASNDRGWIIVGLYLAR